MNHGTHYRMTDTVKLKKRATNCTVSLRKAIMLSPYILGGPQWLKFGVSSPSPSSLSGNSLRRKKGKKTYTHVTYNTLIIKDS